MITGSYPAVTTSLQNHTINLHGNRSLPSTPVNTSSALTQIPNANTLVNHNNNNNDNTDGMHLNSNSNSSNPLLAPSLQNVDAFGSFLGEEIVCNWRRGLEFPPPMPSPTPISMLHASVASLHRTHQMQSMHTNQLQPQPHHSNNQMHHHMSHTTASNSSNNNSINTAKTHSNNNHKQKTNHNNTINLNALDDHTNRHQDDKMSQHEHDASSTASTPILQDSRFDDNHNGGLTPLSLPISKSPQEDNNNHLGALPHGSASFPLGLPFHHQMQERYRFADELHLTPGGMPRSLGDSLIPKSDPMEAKLQEMLRYNMDKYANQNLDTLHISRRVRELLSVHNIGQRLFAKYVLGLSQGTVSELLSKPKPWDKLTEKGRDSYRKMHAWACDENAVLLLKSLIPKKGKFFLLSNLFFFLFDCFLFIYSLNVSHYYSLCFK